MTSCTKLQEGFRRLQPPLWLLSEEEQHAIEHNLPLTPLLAEDFVAEESLLVSLDTLHQQYGAQSGETRQQALGREMSQITQFCASSP